MDGSARFASAYSEVHSPSHPFVRAMPWTKYHLAVTKYQAQRVLLREDLGSKFVGGSTQKALLRDSGSAHFEACLQKRPIGSSLAPSLKATLDTPSSLAPLPTIGLSFALRSANSLQKKEGRPSQHLAASRSLGFSPLGGHENVTIWRGLISHFRSS